MSPRYLLPVALLVFVILATATSLVRPPFRDEAWFANPAVSLLAHGHTGSTLLQEDSWLPNLVQPTHLTRIEQRTYWIMPVHTVLQAAWYEMVGDGLLQMRLLSTLFGGVGLIALFVYASRLYGSTRIATLAVLLTAVDHRWITMAGNGRMDIIAASFGLMGLAWYMVFRRDQLSAAIVGATGAVVLGTLTHPAGIIGAAALVVLAMQLDLKRIGPRQIGVGCAAAAAIAMLFAVYAAQDPEAFRDQLSSNSSGRFRHVFHPVEAIRGAAGLFFGTFAFGGGAGTAGLLIPIGLAIGVAGALLYRRGQVSEHRATRIVLLQIAVAVFYLTFLDSQKLHFYLVHVIPLCIVAGSAFVLHVIASRSTVVRAVAVLALVLFVAIELAPTAVRLARRAHHRVYAPAVEAVRAEAGADGPVVGSPEVAFSLGFDRVRDDRRLRAARRESGVVVILSREDLGYLAWLPEDEQKAIALELAHRSEVFRNDDYTVFGRRP